MVKRFIVKGWNDDHIEVEDPEGKWVSYSDYAKLEAENAEQKERLQQFAHAFDAGYAAAFAAKDANIKVLGEQMVMERLNAYELQDQLSEARKALEPFASAADKHHSGYSDSAFSLPIIKVGHLRAAHLALTGGQEE